MLLTMLVVGVDAMRFHSSTWISPAGAVLALECVIAAVLVGSLLREALRQRAFVRRLPTDQRRMDGTGVLVIPSRRPLAFCAGLLRPRIVISDGLLDLLSERELQSVIAHERHHARRRDPLRRALAQAMCHAFWFIPALRTTASTQVTISELAADAVAARRVGARPLAAALIAFEDHGCADSGASPERVRQIAGARRRQSSGAFSALIAVAILIALAGAVVYLLQAVPAAVCLPLSTALGAPLAVVALTVACVPAGLVGRTAAQAVGAEPA